jgi:hypothetical protein
LRFYPVVDKVFFKWQDAFIRGRFISDGVMALHEILDE